MTFPEFQALIADLRHNQKEYFRTRSPMALENSKRLEKLVDETLLRLKDGQRKLFDQPE